ncbi:glycosyl hydrolase, family 9 [Treponema primitia ZAS-2]|uniref:Glycosyl hydrolase, family 9 n=1 Tax=Treponema primitia (strain ATCC BAA-887 / DSM 12427 / ZAS-2) TaxID=545694 RepID=F5YGZ2_TREPZ|nr:glycoside hydrolase family 9 protein [Treponema primitia]AEF83582.1 glycosyl hydrolase, family 9 [Treponema primitia ZAS-2]
MDIQFETKLKESLYVHYPLEADAEKTVEYRSLKKPVLHRISLWDGTDQKPWTFDGEGTFRIGADGTLALKTGARSDHWPGKEVRAMDAAAGDYATFGSYIARLDLRGRDLSRGNRIYFQIRPACPGLHSPIVRVGFVNTGKIKIPDVYSREGFNAINLKNFEWNTCAWEIDTIAHDRIEEISFEVHRYGKELSTGDELFFELRDIQFQEVQCDVVHGWQCAEETAVFSSSGYFCGGAKTAVAQTTAADFTVFNGETEKPVFSGPIDRVENIHGAFGVMDFSSVETPGTYYLCFGNTRTASFRIGDTVFEDTIWKLINFLYSERCGYPVSGKHGVCHADVVAKHGGLTLPYQGGWHDAADVSQQTVQSAEILHALLQTAEALKTKNSFLYNRLMEEANWGLDFILRMRFGDGYRASNAGIRRWTDGLIGNMDDCEAGVHNHSFENFIMSAVEATAAAAFAEKDQPLSWKCLDAAKEDFAFAIKRFNEIGVETPIPQEHAGSAGLSQYYAAACWAAALLFQNSGDPSFLEPLLGFARKLLDCQETGEAQAPLKGFFYRDETKKTIVHFSHQARDQIFVQALAEACKALPDHEDKALWEAGLKLFGNYLKALTSYTAPYGMLPAGIHRADEIDDRDAFERVHPRVDYEGERKNYAEQLKQGIPLGKEYCIRCFPVWFSFRGNSAIHLSMGKAASILGNYFKDHALLNIAREQLYWTLGKNPFGQSLIYGEGSNFGQQYTALLGETVGEMPVGVQTRGNEDLPYWPQANIATYREVWTTPPGRWLWIAADLLS